MLRLITSRGNWLTNRCGHITYHGTPMVGCIHCRTKCPYNNGIVKFLVWEFVKCKYNNY